MHTLYWNVSECRYLHRYPSIKRGHQQKHTIDDWHRSARTPCVHAKMLSRLLCLLQRTSLVNCPFPIYRQIIFEIQIAFRSFIRKPMLLLLMKHIMEVFDGGRGRGGHTPNYCEIIYTTDTPKKKQNAVAWLDGFNLIYIFPVASAE